MAGARSRSAESMSTLWKKMPTCPRTARRAASHGSASSPSDGSHVLTRQPRAPRLGRAAAHAHRSGLPVARPAQLACAGRHAARPGWWRARAAREVTESKKKAGRGLLWSPPKVMMFLSPEYLRPANHAARQALPHKTRALLHRANRALSRPSGMKEPRLS